jgi:hypothetical protein
MNVINTLNTILILILILILIFILLISSFNYIWTTFKLKCIC